VPKIRLLESRTANQIAAGEVVERPASVVKELLENSLDAGAGRLRVEIVRGGLGEIRVLDDGAGMEAEDLPLALARHATSKISTIEDLSQLTTLGFRGEALPSIASVSQMTLESSPGETGRGTRMEVEGGHATPTQAVGHPRGTSVKVRNLFFNTPGRRKFLRSEATELGRILDTVTRAALAHFDRCFTLIADGRTILDLPCTERRGERVRQVFGEEVAGHLIPFSRRVGANLASGFASRPEFTRGNGKDLRLFVNGRPVRDRGSLAAITQAYATLLPRGRYPFVLLFLELPPERVDFNVHPAKWEVRFGEPGVLFELIRNSIRAALQEERPVTPLQTSRPSGTRAGEDTTREFQGFPVRGADEMPRSGSPAWKFSGITSPRASLFDVPSTGGLARMLPLAQYRQSYILASDEQGLVIVDQHAAHERVLYEQLRRETAEHRVERQAMLFPLTLELDAQRSLSLERGLGRLDGLGFGLEPFGEMTWLVRETPALLGKADVQAVLRDLVDDLISHAAQGELERIVHRLAATTACHAAVKVNFPLPSEKMVYILDELGKTDSPMTCPHGRPVVLRLSHRDLERNFGRR